MTGRARLPLEPLSNNGIRVLRYPSTNLTVAEIVTELIATTT